MTHDAEGNTNVELDSGESATIQSSSAAPTAASGRHWDPAAIRTLKIVGAAVLFALVVIVVLFMTLAHKKDVVTRVDIPVSHANSNERDVQLTPYEQGQRAEAQRKQAEANQAAGGVYVPPPMGAPEQQPARNANPGPGAGSYNSYAGAQTGTGAPGSPEDPAKQQAIQEGMNRQVQTLLMDGDLSGPAITRVAEYQTKKDAAATGGSSAGGTGNFADTGTTEDPDVPGVLTIHVGRLTSPIDTGMTSYASAKIDAGKFAGAFLKGTSTLNKGEGILVTFDTMRLANGRVVKINAIALDEQTSTDALTGTIDRHILTKYVLPITFATVAGGMNAIAQRSSNLVSSGLTTSVVVPEATNKQAGAAGLAAAGQVGQQIVQGLANQPNTGSVNVNTTIGIMFLSVQAPAVNDNQQRSQAQALTAQDVNAQLNQRALAAGQAVASSAQQAQYSGANASNAYSPYNTMTSTGSFALPPASFANPNTNGIR